MCVRVRVRACIYLFIYFTAVNEFRKPKIKQPLLPVAVPKNETAVLTLVLTADPLPDVKWSVKILLSLCCYSIVYGSCSY